MGNKTSQIKMNYEDIQDKLLHGTNVNKYVLINTLLDNKQHCLIPTTINYHEEEDVINSLLNNNSDIEIIIYGMNNNDESVVKKYKQLISLGFQNIYIYLGGMFEWLLLQEVYGNDHFPTTNLELDIIKYRPCKNEKMLLL